jgi:hypothetical protein
MMSIKIKSSARRFALLGALTMIVGLGAASAASATQVPIWTQNGTHIPFGTEVSYNASSVTGMQLQWTQGGMHYWIQCETLSASGKVEDYASGKAGTLKQTAGTFKGCKVVEVGEIQTAWNNTTCSVPKEIPLQFTSGTLTNTPYSGGGLKLSQVELGFVISNCPQNFIKGLEWRFWGDINGNEGNGAWPGEILFPEGTALSMNASGSGATVDFGMNIQGSGFTPIKIAQEEIVEPHNPGHHYWYSGGAQRKGEGARTLIKAGAPASIKGSGNSMTIEAALAGVPTQVACSAGTTSGSVENPAGGGDGTASVSFALSGCTVPLPAGRGCYVEGGTVTTETMAGSLAAAEAFAPLKLTASPKLATVKIRGCTITALNNDWSLTGSLLVSPYLSLGNPGKWSILKSQNEANLLKLGGVKAIASGLVSAETAAGEAVTWTE